MSSVSAALAEVYAAKKIYEERMKTTTGNKTACREQGKTTTATSSYSYGGCFPLFFKKVHPTAAVSPDSAVSAVTPSGYNC
nr:corepressor interacting with RBPJ 1-like [Ipomoea batatas]GMD52136.1 corepressor interacting with RBPJ 1-like [Ipomoea batatas]GME09920.1 corepressor interacting with RBPJ 1-like [Ipomoea batatas]GME09930.1 corepressor interacting with RBPJ 1-like [Ipomoea batatas]GME20559.1 corepressor interacting with RBPJ 1-like [Ipomoea batatas]